LSPQALTLVLALLFIHSVWRATGARIAVVAEAAIVVVVLADLAWSAWVTSGVSIVIVDHAGDAVVGEPVSTEIVVRGRPTPIELRMLSARRPAWYRIDPPDKGTFVAVPDHRGIVGVAVFEVRCSAPLGLVGLNQRFVVDLAHSMTVAPRPELVAGARLPDRGALPSPDDVVRGTRPWVPGDPQRSVHWPSVARTGMLMVKELEPPPAPQIVVAVELGAVGEAAERAASRGAWVASEALRRGCRVILATIEGESVIAAPVRSPLEVGRRLAVATSGKRFTTAPDPRSIIWIRAEGDTFP